MCGLPIDYEAGWREPQSFTADHIIPVSLGGHMTARSNLRAAHRMCNMKRGTGRGTPKTTEDRSGTW